VNKRGQFKHLATNLTNKVDLTVKKINFLSLALGFLALA
jgi:hypothetical protein